MILESCTKTLQDLKMLGPIRFGHAGPLSDWAKHRRMSVDQNFGRVGLPKNTNSSMGLGLPNLLRQFNAN